MVSSKLLSLYTFVLLGISLTTTNALNDWSKPCFEGVCSYDIPDDGDTSSGSLTIWAESTDAIADITNAADWEIIGCDKDTIAQDVRIVCKTEDSENCAKLFSSGSPDGKIIRLPEECGKNAFARVAKSFQPEDQSIPSDIAKRLVRRAGVPTKVEGLTLDADFAAIDSQKFGKIMFAVQGANVPGAKGEIPIGNPSLVRRGLFDDITGGIKDLGEKIVDGGKAAVEGAKDVGEKIVDGGKAAVEGAKDVGEKIVDGGKAAVEGAKDVGEKIVDGAEAAVEGAKDVGEDIVEGAKDVGEEIVGGAKVLFNGAEKGLDTIGDGVKKATEFGKEILKKLNEVEVSDDISFEPIKIDEKFNLFQEKLECDGVTIDASSDANVKLDTFVKLGVMAAGTIVPPNIEDFAITATLSANFASSIGFKGGLTGKFETKPIKLFEAGLPGLSFPGILTVGPALQLEALARAELDLNVNLDVGVNYKITKAQLVFPPRDDTKGGDFQIEDTPLKLSATPSVDAKASVGVSLLPRAIFGLEAIGGIKADVFVNLDASATAELELKASAEGTVEVPTRRRLTSRNPFIYHRQDEVETQDAADPDTAPPSEETTPGSDVAAETSEPGVSTSLSTDFGGCFNVFAGLAVDAGAEGSFFGFFDAKEKVNLFKQNFDLFKKCFGSEKRSLSTQSQIRQYWHTIDKKRRVHKLSRALHHLTLEKRAFTCPKPGVSAPRSVVESENALAGA